MGDACKCQTQLFFAEKTLCALKGRTQPAPPRPDFPELPPKAVLLTFDDGYKDFYTRVIPLLRSFHWPAVLARLQDDADERRRLLDDALQPLLGAVPASARLREVIARRVAVLGPAWSAPGAAALELLRQDGMNP